MNHKIDGFDKSNIYASTTMLLLLLNVISLLQIGHYNVKILV
jgi:hypothetical protein